MLSRLKIGDKVQVISGKERGQQGQVIELSKDKTLVKVREIALVSKFKKAVKVGQPGQLIRVERFINSSKVMLVCPSTGKPCRVRTKVLASGEKVRVSHLSDVQI